VIEPDPERFEVRVQPPARRALTERLPEAVAAAVLDFLDGPLAENPLLVGKRFSGPLEGCHGARRGTYRIAYRVDAQRRVVQVLDIDRRSSGHRHR